MRTSRRTKRLLSITLGDGLGIESPGTTISTTGLYIKDYIGSRISVDVPINDDVAHLARVADPPAGYGTGIVDPDGDGPEAPVTVRISLPSDL